MVQRKIKTEKLDEYYKLQVILAGFQDKIEELEKLFGEEQRKKWDKDFEELDFAIGHLEMLWVCNNLEDVKE